MKICLVNANVNLVSRDFLRAEIQQGLISLAAVLEKANHVVKIVDLKLLILEKNWPIDGYLFNKVARVFADIAPDLIGINTRCDSFPTSINIARASKKVLPEVPVVMGGFQVTFIAGQTLATFPFIDYVLRGEAEYSLLELVNTIEKGGDLRLVKGLTFRQNGNIVENPDRETFADMDLFPVPAYHHYESQLLIPEISTRREIYIDVGRGCPYSCKFCVCNKIYRGKYRMRSPEKVIDEIKLLKSRYGIKGFNIGVDHFLVDRDYVKKFCNLILKEKLDITWGCNARPENADEDLLLLMKNSGLYSIFFGIETGSRKVQKDIQKNLNLSGIIPLLEICDRLKIFTVVAFILGFPGETEKDIDRTLRLAVDCNKFFNVYSEIRVLAPMAGSEIYDSVKDNLKWTGLFNDIAESPTAHIPANLELIKKYPELFSVFYSIPLKEFSSRFLHGLVRFYSFSVQHFPLTIQLAFDEMEVGPVEFYRMFMKWAVKKKFKKSREFIDKHSDIILLIPRFLKEEYQKRNIQRQFMEMLVRVESRAAYNKFKSAYEVFRGLGGDPEEIDLKDMMIFGDKGAIFGK
ncbi:MAG: radical SAM protein [Candidatus Eremiobacteraeota bacterium]|nr:radical SAM protein [Candidatus Eremiobacteraeota bacterium]